MYGVWNTTINSYLEEYAFVQFNKDFERVAYGTEEQVKAQKKLRTEQLEKISEAINEDDPEIAEAKRIADEKAKKHAEKNKKKKEKKKQKLAELKATSVQVNAQVQSELNDLIANFSLSSTAESSSQK